MINEKPELRKVEVSFLVRLLIYSTWPPGTEPLHHGPTEGLRHRFAQALTLLFFPAFILITVNIFIFVIQ